MSSGRRIGFGKSIKTPTPSPFFAQSLHSILFRLGLLWQSLDSKIVVCKVSGIMGLTMGWGALGFGALAKASD